LASSYQSAGIGDERQSSSSELVLMSFEVSLVVGCSEHGDVRQEFVGQSANTVVLDEQQHSDLRPFGNRTHAIGFCHCCAPLIVLDAPSKPGGDDSPLYLCDRRRKVAACDQSILSHALATRDSLGVSGCPTLK
jgi:hypothetical protein